MRLRALASILAVAALVAAGVTFSGAAFTAASANPGNNFATAASFATVTMTDPGSPLRGTVTLGATTTGTVVSVTIQRSPAGAGTWTDICTDASSPYTCSFDTTVPADGLYDLRASADDGSGTVYSAPVADRRIDNTAPSVTMTDPGTPLSGSITLGATATDVGGSGVSSVTIQRSPAGAGTWTDVCTDSSSPYSCSFDTTIVGDALYDFRAFGSDVAGNGSPTSTVSNRRIDNVAPTASLTDPGTPLTGTVTLNASASDGGGIANVKIQRSPAGAGTWTDICTDSSSPYSCSFDTTGVADGLYDLRAVSTDNASRSTNSTVVTNRRVDNTAPTVSMTDPGTPLSGTVTLGATASDTGSGVASVKIQRSPAGLGTWTDICTDNSSPYSCSFDTTIVGDALYDFRAVATDNATLTNSSTVTNRRIDNVDPTVSLTDPGANIRGTISLDATASDGGGILNVKIQRSPATLNNWTDICTDATSPYSCSTDTSTWGGDGLYDVRAIATDNASRTATSTVTNRRVDNTLPTVTMTDPGANLRGTIILNATASDTGSGVSSVTIQRSPASAGTWTDVCTDLSSPYSCTGVDTTTWGGDGLYDLRAVTIDVAGNPNTSATVANRRVDNTAPVTVLTDPGAYIRGTVTLNATGTDTGGSGVLNVKFQRSPAGGGVWTDLCTDAVTPYSCNTNTATWGGDGVYDVRSYATDNAGNTTASMVASRTVDNTAPTATNIQTTNVGGGTAGLPEAGDTMVFTFSEQIAPGTIVGGWNGTGTQTVTVTMDTANHLSIASATLVNGFVTLGGTGYVNAGKTVVFTNSTISQAGAVVTLTLGTPDKPQFLNAGSAGQTSWPVAAALTDIAGNAITTVTRLEVTPPNDAEF